MSTERLLRLSIIAGFVAFAVAWLVTNPVAILVALFLTGVGLSLAWPLSMSRIIRASEGSTDRASSLALAFTTTAIGLAPFVLGALAGSLGVHVAFLIVPVLLAVTLVLVVVRPVPEDVRPSGGRAPARRTCPRLGEEQESGQSGSVTSRSSARLRACRRPSTDITTSDVQISRNPIHRVVDMASPK